MFMKVQKEEGLKWIYKKLQSNTNTIGKNNVLRTDREKKYDF